MGRYKRMIWIVSGVENVVLIFNLNELANQLISTLAD